MTVLYRNPCFIELCYKGTALYQQRNQPNYSLTVKVLIFDTSVGQLIETIVY